MRLVLSSKHTALHTLLVHVRPSIARFVSPVYVTPPLTNPPSRLYVCSPFRYVGG